METLHVISFIIIGFAIGSMVFMGIDLSFALKRRKKRAEEFKEIGDSIQDLINMVEGKGGPEKERHAALNVEIELFGELHRLDKEMDYLREKQQNIHQKVWGQVEARLGDSKMGFDQKTNEIIVY